MIFRPKKLKFLKTLKMELFQRGLVHGFCQEIEYFVMGIFWAN